MGPLRGAAGLSQQALAERVKIDVTYLSKLENGRQHASDRVLRALAEALGVEPVRLLVMAGRIPSELQGTVQEALLGEATSTELLSRPEGAPAGRPTAIAERTRPGLLVTLEGPGGGGKSTVAGLVAGRLAVAGLPVMATTEPSRTELGSFVRRSTDEYGGLTLAYLVAADRHHHLETEVRPALGAGRVVICDRYVASSLVLQGMDGVEEQTIWDLARHAELPDLAVVLSASPEVLAARVGARGPHSRWERYPGNSAIEAGLYVAAAAGLRARGVEVVCVDSSATSAAAIADQVAELVRSRFDRRTVLREVR